MTDSQSASSKSRDPEGSQTRTSVQQNDLFLWLRSEILNYGLLPLSPHSDISFHSLLSLVKKYRYTHELNTQYLTAINTLYSTKSAPEHITMSFGEWDVIAAEDLLLNPIQSRTFCIVRDNLVGTTKTSRSNKSSDSMEVNFYEFIIYLYIQIAMQPSFGAPWMKPSKWVSQSSSSAGSQKPSTKSNKQSKRTSVSQDPQSQAKSSEPKKNEGRSPSFDSASSPAGDSSISLTDSTGTGDRQHRPSTETASTSKSKPRTSMAKTNLSTFLKARNTSRMSFSLPDQEIFVHEHLSFILRLLSADEPNFQILRSELEPLNFLFAVGYSYLAIHDLNLIDILPKAATTEKYSRLDLAEWILHRHRINYPLYSLNINDAPTPEDIQLLRLKFPPKKIINRPIMCIDVHNRTLLRTDNDSINVRNSAESVLVNKSFEPVDSRFAVISNCSSSFIYLLAPLNCVHISYCVGSIIVLGAVSSIVTVSNCQGTTIISACQHIQILDCESCVFYLLVNAPQLLLGNNYGLKFGPYCTHYRSLERHVREAGLDTNQNYWDSPLLFASELLKDHPPNIPFGSNRHPLRVAPSKMEKQIYTLVQPETFAPFRVPFDLHGQTKQIPFPLPSDYQLALEDHTEETVLLKKELERLINDRNKQNQIQATVRAKFERWLADSGAMQQIEDLVKMQIQ